MSSVTTAFRRHSACLLPSQRGHTTAVASATGELQFGIADDVALTVPLPEGIAAEEMLTVLRRLDDDTSLPQALAASADTATSAAASELVGALQGAGILTPSGPGGAERQTRPFTVHVVGEGDLARRLAVPLSQHGIRLDASPRPTLDFDVHRPPWTRPTPADLVILADELVPDPVVLTALHRSATPHTYLACRDGRMVVGPTVHPGRTSCLRCADHHRADRNPRWPQISAQLLWTSGWAPVPTRVAGIALLASEVLALRRDDAPEQLVTSGHSVELSVSEGMWRRRRWEPHLRCDCGAAAPISGTVVA